MIPVVLLGSTVYMVRFDMGFPDKPLTVISQALHFVRTNLSHESYLDQARARVQELETKLNELQQTDTSPSSTDSSAGSPPSPSSNRWWIF